MLADEREYTGVPGQPAVATKATVTTHWMPFSSYCARSMNPVDPPSQPTSSLLFTHLVCNGTVSAYGVNSENSACEFS